MLLNSVEIDKIMRSLEDGPTIFFQLEMCMSSLRVRGEMLWLGDEV